MGTKILVELFNLNNPVAGPHAIDVTTVNKKGNVLEVIPPIAYSTFAGSGTGDITAVNTPAGAGLAGGGTSGDVNLSLQLCAAGQVLKSVGTTWACAADNDTDTNSGGTVTSITAGAGLTATPNPITTTGTVAIASSFQLPQGCGNGQVAEWNGSTWVCANDDNSGGTVTGVTASAPLQSSGGNAPNITLPNVIIQSASTFNTAIGDGALQSNTTGASNAAIGRGALLSNTTGSNNTALGRDTLFSNTSGSNNTASGISALQNNISGTQNTATGVEALQSNTTGASNAAIGRGALLSNTTGDSNTASGVSALFSNTTGSNNTAIGRGADVSVGNLTNATAIGASAVVNASNKVRLGDANVTVIEGQVGFTASSDKTKKENFKPVDGEEVLRKLRGFTLTSWNFIGHDPKQFRHYGPMAQDFFAAFGSDGVGTVGTETTINSGDMAGILMIAVQALEKRTVELKEKDAKIEALEARLERLERMPGSLAMK